jgi:hypothetical protein
MPTRKQEMQHIIRMYRAKTGETSVNMKEVADYAIKQGWPLPKPKSAVERLAEQFSAAAREEYRTDTATGHPYRAYMAVTERHGDSQLTLWTDSDQAPRHIAHKSVVQRREQVIGDVVHIKLDADHWNRMHPNEEPITVPLDFGDDVDWRLNAPPDDEMKAA